MWVNESELPGSAEVVRLDGAGRAYGVSPVTTNGAPSWVIFTGDKAGLRAYAYADANFADVKTGRRAAPADVIGDVLALAS